MRTAKKTIKKVSLIGLGQMGRKMARMYIDAGYEVTLWNRTLEKTREFEDVNITESAQDAIARSPFVIICVYDNSATLDILNNLADQGVLEGKTIVNLTTGGPDEALEIEKIVSAQKGNYINGAIQVAPDQMGKESTTILLSGNKKAYDEHRSTFDILGGNLKFLGEKAAASSAMDLATLTWLYGSYIGLIYGVSLGQKYGLDLEDYSRIIGEITPGFTEFFQYEIDVINRGDYSITQSPLPISIAATQRIADSFKELNVLREFPEAIKNILEQAGEKGLGNEELAAIIKVINKQV
ncbi:NAD(P)-dependent oxidoreductase [Sinomicrobium pectinilyticum]|uniref:NAD(P)-dependent oxidoreductase n=1 Tax=Sinomicrobium pectinilyticum TaxID=1084421 RepID=A0A3N0DYV4_SINP1|nr:NAD(P)-binding domain-containing protein [Sinomicrobium pectinilyticum]RNL80790.1 NAD(P)-dependent oxidoreductase [Sinomicrobium pectinilyticum]